ncbi:MAG TPA: hypothetical protein VM509_15190 [Planctomycetota bacterium]|nr:hypothetical protein [Planctomycetota bacterium]
MKINSLVFRRAPLALVCFAAASCHSSGLVATPPKSTALGRQILPLPPDSLISFTANGAEVSSSATGALVRKLEPPPADYGRPIASSVDLGSWMGAVVHERGLAVLNLTSPETEPLWLPLAWTKPPTSIFVSDANAATLGGTEACLWDLTNAKLAVRRDLAEWSTEHRLGPAVCIVPDRAKLTRATVLFSSPESTDVQVLDFSRGNPEMIASSSNIFQNTKRTWWRVERCAYDGENLFLSGTKEAVGTDSSGRVVPQPSPFLMKLDLATREHEILSDENTHERDQTVDEIAAAKGLVATVRRDGLLRVFRGREKSYEVRVARGSAIAWLSGTSLAVYDASSSRVIDLTH